MAKTLLQPRDESRGKKKKNSKSEFDNSELVTSKNPKSLDEYGYGKEVVGKENDSDDDLENDSVAEKDSVMLEEARLTTEGEQEFSYDLKIPKDRIGVLVGKGGEIKRILERDTECKIDIDSKEGEVFIFGTDGLKLFIAKNIISAIARGFNPQVAIQLLKPDFNFELIDLNDFGRKDQHLRLKGRVIGREGNSRALIEEFTNCQVCVYGKTVGIIGRVEYVEIAKRACVSLLEGATHATVYKWLEKKRRQLKINEMISPAGGIPKEAIKTKEDKRTIEDYERKHKKKTSDSKESDKKNETEKSDNDIEKEEE
jgi:ribosomal RNA assembly protein